MALLVWAIKYSKERKTLQRWCHKTTTFFFFACSLSVIIINIFPTATLWNADGLHLWVLLYFHDTNHHTGLRGCKVRPEKVLCRHTISELEENLEINSYFAKWKLRPREIKTWQSSHNRGMVSLKLEKELDEDISSLPVDLIMVIVNYSWFNSRQYKLNWGNHLFCRNVCV